MRGIFLSITMALALAMPFAETSLADPWYRVKHDATVPGTDIKGAALMTEPHGRGTRKCVVRRDELVQRDWGENWSRWIYVWWRSSDVFDGHMGHPGGEGYCPVWNMHGWIDKEFLVTSTGGIRADEGLAAKTNWYVTKQPTEIKSERPKGGQPRGVHKCTVPKGEHVHRDNLDRSGEPDWIYVRWKKSPNQNYEWNYHGTWGPGTNNYCEDSKRHGWVLVGKLKPVRDPEW